MKSITSFALLISFMGLTTSTLILDREFDAKKLAEGNPLTVTYTLYNTFGK